MKDPPNIDLLELEVEGDRPGLLEVNESLKRLHFNCSFYFLSYD